MAKLSLKKIKHAGFTLIELIVTLVIMSIISIGITAFILDSVTGYINTSARNQISSAGRIVIDRISMEIHNALPKSVRITSAYTAGSSQVLAGNAYAGDQCLEFIPVRAASTYINPPFRTASSAFEVVEFVPDQAGAIDTYSFIYPVNTNSIYQNPTAARGTRASVLSIAHDASNDTDLISLTAPHRFSRKSRVQRIFLSDQPVSFCAKGNRIYRYDNYGFTSNQLRPVNIDGSCSVSACLPVSTPKRLVLTTELDNAGITAFDQLEASRRRNGIVQLELNFSKNGESVLLNHETLLQASP